MRPRAVILASGGLDSTTCLAIARERGFELHSITFDYGQRHLVELDAAARVARAFDVQQHLVVRFDMRSIGGSALTANFAVPRDRDSHAVATDIPITYVPARNTVFLSFALGWAEVLECSDIFIGVNSLDYSGYPDCRPEYIEAYQRMAALATRAGVEGNPVRIQTPIIGMTKAEIIREGLRLGVDYGLTHSCYDPVGPEALACGHCDSCRLRLAGFEAAGVKDPVRYA